MGCGLATCGPEHHSSPALGTLSDRNVIAQVSWEDATSGTRINGFFNLLRALNRSQLSTLFLDVADVLHTSFSQPWTTCQNAGILSTLHDVFVHFFF